MFKFNGSLLMKPLKFPMKTVPLVLLLLCLISFGLLIPWLGFYWDDWPFILMGRLQGARGFIEFFKYDRPYSGWLYILISPILGSKPYLWHFFSLFLRWMTTVAMWLSLRSLWPGRLREITWMTFLFAIYPSFNQQPVSVTYAQGWLDYLLFFVSVGCMIQMVRSPRRFWIYLAISIITLCLNLSISEYFIGLEVLRPIFLWLVLRPVYGNWEHRIKKVLVLWSPYLIVTLAYISWRLFFVKISGGDPNRPELLFDLISQPFPTLVHLCQVILQDFSHIVLGTWYETIKPELIDLTRSFFLVGFLISLFSAVMVAFYLSHLQSNEMESSPKGDKWLHQPILIGFIAVLLGSLPAWITNRQAIVGLYASRFGLAAMFGISMLVIGLIEWFSSRKFPKIVLISVLIGLAVNYHIYTANQYRWSWEKQSRFYWQLFWRAPYIKPNTAILSDGEIFPYVGIYSTSTGINLLYPQPENSTSMAYWFFSLGRGLWRDTEELIQGSVLSEDFRTFSFKGESLDSLVLFYEPVGGRCLWVLSPDDVDNDKLPKLTTDVAGISNLDRIVQEPPKPWQIPQNIFGHEPVHDWCYYFEKAELAAQMGDWQRVAELGLEAERNGFHATDARELISFIEGYARSGMLSLAEQWTIRAYRVNPLLESRLCKLWTTIENDSPSSSALNSVLTTVRDRIKCVP